MQDRDHDLYEGQTLQKVPSVPVSASPKDSSTLSRNPERKEMSSFHIVSEQMLEGVAYV